MMPESPCNPGRDGAIATFYSYKGGVGRTFALANIGALLASWGHRVLLVDWDLEAPGLHHYFLRRVAAPDPQGLLECLEAYERNGGRQPLNYRPRVVPVPIPTATVGELGLLVAGAVGGDYNTRMQALDWSRLYGELRLGHAIESLREEWKRRYDFVLVDSRTGVTDIGGICTVQLPDFVMMLATANEQSLQGLKSIAESARHARQNLPVERERLDFVPILTRFEARTERELAKRWLDRFAGELGELYAGWIHRDLQPREVLAHTQIPHVPYWSFGEELPVLDEGIDDPESIGHAFATVAALVAHKLDGTAELVRNRDEFVRRARRAFVEPPFHYDVFVQYARKATGQAEELAKALEQAGLRVWTNSRVDPGETWIEQIETAIAKARHHVVLVTGAAASPYQRMELDAIFAEHARRGHGRIVPVVLRTAISAVPKELLQYQRLVYDQSPTEVAEALAQELSLGNSDDPQTGS